jgi:aspartyl-tRNA(Asn)/glutamyl-tRNA(Gln) amidotransferase subunit C
MAIDEATVLRCAKLAKLELSSDEIPKFQAQLGEILEFARKLQEVDTQNIEPTLFLNSTPSPLREDSAKPSSSVEDALCNAPDTQNGFFRVPRVI